MIEQVVYNGLLAGSLYALVALGYTLIYGVARLINFAHGDVMTVSAYACWVTSERLHAPLPAALALSLIVGPICALLIERIAVRPASRSRDPLAPVISTIGASVVLQATVSLFFGVRSQSLAVGSYGDG